ncbi:CbiX/SirB N-terminal domain-containing protein [Actinoplanes sp. NPDC023936]|uniref:sirohydrochlorin chelatase n=1 Tax=Actinoplanes sp. NPDC023936 TaxID=3154910 RepID=UPI003403EDE0
MVLVAHGSRDPRAAVATEALARAVRRAHPEWLVEASYLDHAGPRPLDVLASAPAARAVLVPLLLTSAYHGRVDLPAVVRAAASLPITVTATDVLGPASPLLLSALSRRLLASAPRSGTGSHSGTSGGVALPRGGVFPGGRLDGVALPPAGSCPGGLDGVVLASAGTRDEAARATVADAAAALGRRLGLPAEVAYASGAGPAPGEAVAALRAAGARRVGMSAYFLAPGLLYDLAARTAREAGAVAVAEPLTAATELVRLVAARVESALGHPLPMAA